MRYVEIEGQLRKIMMVIKMRGGAHSKDIREYDITSDGIVLGERPREYAHLITGIPERIVGSQTETIDKRGIVPEVIDGNGAKK